MDGTPSKRTPRTALPEVLVVGAGLAGIAAARGLREAGHAVRIAEKSRGLGGRLATRRTDAAAFDHGAPHVDVVPGTAFAAAVEAARAAGAAAPWAAEGDAAPPAGARRLVGLPGMSGLAGWLAAELDVLRGCEVVALAREGRRWIASLETRGEGPARLEADLLVLAVPAPQAARLLATADVAMPELAHVRMVPTWTLLADFGADALPDGPDVLRPRAGPLSRIVREGRKPGRSAPGAVVAHARADFSRETLEAAPEAIAERLAPALASGLGADREPVYVSCHRWRYAAVDSPLGAAYLLLTGQALALVGDWTAPGGAQAAWESGATLASAVARRA